MYYWNENEEKIIGTFINKVDKLEGLKLLLKWNDETQIIAFFDMIIEDEDECDMESDGYEEFWSFVFKVVEVKGHPPVYITEDDCFIINYRNFPDQIFAGGQKIN